MKKSVEEFIKWLGENLGDWGVCITQVHRKRNKYKYDKTSGELLVVNENGSKYTIKKDKLRKIAQRYINAPSEKRNKIGYYQSPTWKEPGLNLKADPYVVHVLRCWWEGKTPEKPEDVLIDSHEELPNKGLKISTEKCLEDFIIENFNKIDFGAKLKYIARQYPTDKPDKKIDILAKDEEKKEYVVIELKKGRPSDQVVGQILRYIHWVKTNLARKENYTTRGIIITTEKSGNLEYALKEINGVDVYLRDISISLKKL